MNNKEVTNLKSYKKYLFLALRIFFALILSFTTTGLLIYLDTRPKLIPDSVVASQHFIDEIVAKQKELDKGPRVEGDAVLKTFEEINTARAALQEVENARTDAERNLANSQGKLESPLYWVLGLALEIAIFYAYFRGIPIIIRAIIKTDKKLGTLIVGVIGLIFGFLMDTTVPTGLGHDRVNNIGLMQQQQNILIVSGIAILIGFFMAKVKTKEGINALEIKKCSYCAESIKKDAILCRFCGKDV